MNANKYFSYLICIFYLVIYPMTFSIEIFDVSVSNFNYVLIVCLFLIVFLANNCKLTYIKKTAPYVIFSVLSFLVIFIINLYNGFDNINFNPELISLNLGGEIVIENSISYGDYAQNINAYLKYIIGYPICYFTAQVIKRHLNDEFVCRVIQLFLFVEFSFICFQFFTTGNTAERLSGTFFYIGGAQGLAGLSLVMYSYLLLSKSNNKEKNRFFSLSFFGVIQWLCFTRSSLILLPFLFVKKLRNIVSMEKSYLIWLAFSLFPLLVLFSYDHFVNLIDIDPIYLRTFELRMKLWFDTWKSIENNVFIGAGAVPVVTDNLFLTWFASFGLIGLIFHLLFFINVSRFSDRRTRFLIFMIFIQGIMFPGLFHVDLLPVTYFILGISSTIFKRQNYG